MAKQTKEQYREQAAVKVVTAEEVLATEVAALVTGDDWRRFLDCQAKLYDYGANNVMLIFAQHAEAYEQGRVPEPTPAYVAGFDTWQALGRHVEKGQHGYITLAPIRSIDGQAQDAEGTVRVLHPGDAPSAGETETKTPVSGGFRPETVFDLSQTNGAELSRPPRPELRAGEAPAGLGEAVLHMIEERGWKVTTVTGAIGPDGVDATTSYGTKVITVRGDMDDAAMVTTLIQEAGHVLLHAGPPGRYLSQPLKEIEAESVAYVVASVHGMATDGYRFPDVAAWSGERAERAVRSTQARVNGAAQAIIAASPAEHETGSKPPGTTLAITAMRQVDQENAAHLAELRARLAGRSDEAVPTASYAGPEVA